MPLTLGELFDAMLLALLLLAAWHAQDRAHALRSVLPLFLFHGFGRYAIGLYGEGSGSVVATAQLAALLALGQVITGIYRPMTIHDRLIASLFAQITLAGAFSFAAGLPAPLFEGMGFDFWSAASLLATMIGILHIMELSREQRGYAKRTRF